MTLPAGVRIDEAGDTWVRYNFPPGSDSWVEVNKSKLEREEAETMERLRREGIKFNG